MRPEAATAYRRQEIREAAQAWRDAGFVSEDQHTAIRELYPDDRMRVGIVFRLLRFGLTLVGILSTCALWDLLVFSQPEEILLLAAGLACAAFTEYQMGPQRRQQAGSEAASSLLALVFLSAAGVFVLEGGTAASLLAAVLFALGAWRWGYAAYAGISAAAFFLFLAQWPGARWFWILFPLLVLPRLVRGSESERLAPPHRRGLLVAAAVCLTAFYVAVHLGSLDARLLELISSSPNWNDQPAASPGTLARSLSIAAMTLFPIALLIAGIRTRRRLLLDAGLVAALASLVTLRFYVQLAPLWVVLLAAGGGAVLLALALRRILNAGPGREIAGITAEPLLEGGGGEALLEMAASVSTLSPEARPAEAEPGFRGGGGRSGGGGAGGGF